MAMTVDHARTYAQTARETQAQKEAWDKAEAAKMEKIAQLEASLGLPSGFFSNNPEQAAQIAATLGMSVDDLLPTPLVYRDADGIVRSSIDDSIEPEWVQKQYAEQEPGAGASLQLKKIGNDYYNFNPKTGELTPLGMSSGGGGTYASSQEYLAAKAAADAEQERIKNAFEWQKLLNEQKQTDTTNAYNEKMFGETVRGNDASINAQQVGQGQNFRDFLLRYQQHLDEQEKDPFSYGQYLTNLQNAPAGAGNPLQSLIGAGVSIAPQLGSVESDPRFKRLMDLEYERTLATPKLTGDNSVSAVRQAYGTDPNSEQYKNAQRFFSQDPEALKRMFGQTHAAGGDQVLHEPTMGIGMISGKPKFLAGEAGPERLTFAPMHEHDTDGMKVPHEHDGPPDEHEHEGDIVKYGKGGSLRIGGGVNLNKYLAERRGASGSINAAAQREQGIADNLRNRGWLAKVEADGAFTLDGVRYSKGTTADMYERGAKQLRSSADPLQYSTGGLKRGFTGGSLMRPDELAAAQLRLGGPNPVANANETGTGGATPSTTGSLTGDSASTTRSATTPSSLGGPTALEASAAAGLSPLNKSQITPAQASAVSLGKALRPMGFVPPELLAYLDAGQAPPPALVDDRMLSKLPPSLQQLLLGVVRQFGNKTEDWTQAQGQWNTPGFRGYVTL